MGQKVNPNGIRLLITKSWESAWFGAGDKQYSDAIISDFQVRKYLNEKLSDAGVARIRIERLAKSARITIRAARPGVIIGQKGRGAEILRAEVEKILLNPAHIVIEEVRKPELEAKLVAETVAKQLEQRIMFRKAMKRVVSSAMRAGAGGIKICVSGRLGGAEIARSEWYREGRVPLHTFRADIDYALAEAKTTYGIIGVKVWIFKTERFNTKSKQLKSQSDRKAGDA